MSGLNRLKNIEAPEPQHLVKLPTVCDSAICPVTALPRLFNRFHLKPQDPLYILDDYHLLTQSHLRSRLATFLHTMGLPLEGHGFHTFHRSAPTLVYDANASLTTIKAHGLWNSDAIWCYIKVQFLCLL